MIEAYHKFTFKLINPTPEQLLLIPVRLGNGELYEVFDAHYIAFNRRAKTRELAIYSARLQLWKIGVKWELTENNLALLNYGRAHGNRNRTT